MLEKLIVRPVSVDDLDQLEVLANSASHGLTSLPKNKELLQLKIDKSIESFSKYILVPKDELYFFVCEDIITKKIVGTTAIESSVGGSVPFYSFEKVNYLQKSGKIRANNLCLEVSSYMDCVSELCTLFVHPDYRKGGVGRFLSLVRFLFIAQNRHRFKKVIITEFRGVSYENGKCPFWDYVMYPFFKMSFSQADTLSAISKEFVKQLAPKHPIYIKLLPQFIHNILGKVHASSIGAEKILTMEGFIRTPYIDLFDAGPKYEARVKSIKAVNRVGGCKKIQVSDKVKNHNHYILNTGKLLDFRACCIPTKVGPETDKIFVYPTKSLDQVLNQGKINRYLKVTPAIKMEKKEEASMLDIRGLRNEKQFTEVFSKWHDKLYKSNKRRIIS